jgi:hypothetical protein
MNNELRETALQIFKDCYLQAIRGKYGFCYYMRIPNGRGAYLDIKLTERILADIPLKALSPEIILQEYKRIRKAKKLLSNDDYDGNDDSYYDGRRF